MKLASTETETEYLTSADVGRRLGLTPASVRMLARTGKLPHTRTASGTRLYNRNDVERYAAERAALRRNHAA
jgi:DNA-binding transcriptional MerR regulator